MRPREQATFKSWALLLSCLAVFPMAAWSQESEAYYMVGDEKVMLTPSSTYRALQIRPDVADDQRAELFAAMDAAEFATVQTSPVLEAHGIVLLEIREGGGPTSFSEGVASFSDNESVESETPVFSVRGADQVLVNEFYVQFAAATSSDEAKAALDAAGAEVVATNAKIDNRFTIRFPGKSARVALDLSNALAEQDQVEFSEPAFVVIVPARPRLPGAADQPAAPSEAAPMAAPSEAAPMVETADEPGPSAPPNDVLFGTQWYMNNTGSTGVADADVDAPKAWDESHGSSTVIVAIIDEGVQTTHPDLAAKIETPYDATDGDNNQEPRNWDGHGTACAGIAAAVTNNAQGVAGLGWDVHIMPVRIAYSNYSGGPWVSTWAIIEDGIREAVDRGAHVLSNSWGGGYSNLVNNAIDYAIANNRVVVFAAGNDSGAVSWPANLSDTKVLIAVSATNEWDEFKTTTSSDGENWWGSNFGPEVNVSAPGVHMQTTDITGGNGYAAGDYVPNFNGTSSATPLVAGAAALLVAENPGWTPTQVRNQLQSSADDKGTAGFDNQFGHGRLNACKALGGCGPPPTNCTTMTLVGTLGHGPTISQTLVNLTLLLSTLLLLALLPLLRQLMRPA